MRIMVFPRKWFLDIRGTEEERGVFEKWNVISINTPPYAPKNFPDEEPPFSGKFLSLPSVLALKFHDTEKQWDDQVVLMTDADADAVYDFVQRTKGNGMNGYIVHCTAGKSRSQAVGYVLNEYFNGRHGICPDEVEYDEYERRYASARTMNALVKGLLMERFFNGG